MSEDDNNTKHLHAEKIFASLLESVNSKLKKYLISISNQYFSLKNQFRFKIGMI